MSRPQWVVELIKKTFSSRFWLAKLTHFPPLGRLVDWGLFAGDDTIEVWVNSDKKMALRLEWLGPVGRRFAHRWY